MGSIRVPFKGLILGSIRVPLKGSYASLGRGILSRWV